MPKCVCCKESSPLLTDFHQFTNKPHLRGLWLDALSKDDTEKAALDVHLRTAKGKQYVHNKHFASDSYVETATSRFFKPDAVPVSKASATVYIKYIYYHIINTHSTSPSLQRALPSYRTPTVPSPPPTPGAPLQFSQSAN